MKKKLINNLLLFTSICFLWSCGKDAKNIHNKENQTPVVNENGKTIIFPSENSIKSFETEDVTGSNLDNEIIAPAKVAATVLNSNEGSQHIILFEDPNLADNYTNLIQTSINIAQIENINIKQKKIEFERLVDLQKHGAATGKDVLDAQTALSMERTNLANERAGIIEHEAILKAGGFQPEILKNASPGTAYIICDIPENQISKIKNGNNCFLSFTAYPNEKFIGKIEGVADMIDQVTRMFKLRVSIKEPNNKFKAGMFASVTFKIDEGENISISKNSLVTIQGENYVFVKINATTFERRKVIIGSQIKDRIIIESGLKAGEKIAVKSVMQLKGLSFGY